MIADEMNESSYCEMGRILYKLANVLCVNSHEEYNQLHEVLTRSVDCFQQVATKIDIEHRMLFVVSKYQLIMLEMHYALNGISSIQVLDTKTLQLKDRSDTPHLRFISTLKIGDII